MKLLETQKDNMENSSQTPRDDLQKSMDEPLREQRLDTDQTPTQDDKRNMLLERSNETESFLVSLAELKQKLENKKGTIKNIIEKKVEENLREVNKWRDLLFTVVDECLNEKIESLSSQERFLAETHKEMKKVLESMTATPRESRHKLEVEEETEDPQLDDLLALDLKLEPIGLSQAEITEGDFSVRKDFTTVLSEPKKSLRRTFTFVAGIIRGYLRRGKSNIDWIRIMRRLEGRELEECMFSTDNDPRPYIGTKPVVEEQPPVGPLKPQTNSTWDSVLAIYQHRKDEVSRAEKVKALYLDYERNPEEVEFYLPQLCSMLLQYKDFQPLKDFILAQCTKSFHFALRTYLFIRANKDSRVPPQKKKLIPKAILKWRNLCDHLLAEIVNAVSIPTLSDGDQTEVNREELFLLPIQFMENMINISKELVALWDTPEKFQPTLTALLEEQNAYLQTVAKEHPAALAYVPLLKENSSPDFHKIVAIPVSEAFPIPTYGRVLYYVWLEVIDVQDKGQETPRREKKKKEKKKKEEKKDDESTADESSPRISPRTSHDSLRNSKKIPEKSPFPASGDSKPTSFGELMEQKSKRIRKNSSFGMIPTWRIQPLIIKYRDQVLQEEFGMQLVVAFQRIFEKEQLPVKVCTYRILAVTPRSGFIEPVPNSLSLDKLKKSHTNLLNFFIKTYGEPAEPSFKQAQQNFVRTLAGYSIVCYLLQLKDR
eukprot:TRINITY_DN2202_c0_g2_i1.p1 TRINITY_DN2202_c0_g2~~TRINITY_DN2202_c0_g2_i1.p1  ORF type:complete len:713 (-),score=200.74 TRINITY_DN2202_c0_g2_i1:526-2664(-)